MLEELEQQLEKNGISVTPTSLPVLGPFSPSSSGNGAGAKVKQEPVEDGSGCGSGGAFSPSSTPQTAKIATSLQEMQIASPPGSATLLKLAQPHQSGFLIGSAPGDMASYLSQQQQQHPNGVNNVADLSFLQQRQQQQQQQPMEFGG